MAKRGAWGAPAGAYHTFADVVAGGAAAGKSAAEARKRAAETAQREAVEDPDLAAALAASMADVDSGGGGGGGAAPRPMELESEEAEIARAIALSLRGGGRGGGGGGGGGVSGGGGAAAAGGGGSSSSSSSSSSSAAAAAGSGRGAALLPSIVGHLLQVRATVDTSAPEPPANAPSVRLVVRMSSTVAPFGGLGATPAAGAKLTVERRFAPDAPLSAVVAWAEAAWVTAWVGEAAVEATADAGIFEELEQPPPSFHLLCRGLPQLSRGVGGTLNEAGVTADTLFNLLAK